MKIATRIALLQFQANPADPANLWRLMIAWFTPGMREEPLRPALHDTHPNVALSDAVFGPLTRIKAFIVGRRKSAIGIVALFIMFGSAWFFRYEPMGAQDLWERVWDRWYGRVCITPRPEITNVQGIACSKAEVGALIARISAEAAARDEQKRPAREGAQRARDEALARQEAELEREKKAHVAAQEKAETLRNLINSYVQQWYAPNKWQINQFRTAGHSEEYIVQQVMPWRNKLLAAGAPKEVADEYFGGDPFLKPGVKP
jgi:hypothetical protein